MMSASADFSCEFRTIPSSIRKRSRCEPTARENAIVSPVVRPTSRISARRSRKSLASLLRSRPWRAAASRMSEGRRWCGAAAGVLVAVHMSTNCISSSDGDAATAGITRCSSVSRILIAIPSPSLVTPCSMYAAIHSPSRKRRIALRAVLSSPGAGSSSGSSTDPKTTYLMSRVGTMRARSGSDWEKTGKPSALIVLASDSPSSRPPSRRWTATLMRRGGTMRARSGSDWEKTGKPSALIVLASDSPSSRPPSRRWTTTLMRRFLGRGSSGVSGGGVAVMSSLIRGASQRARLASGCSIPASLGTKSLRRSPPVEDPFRAWHSLRHALALRGASRDGRGAAVAPRLGDHDPDRHRDERRAKDVAASLFGLDPSAVAVGRVVQRRDRLVEPLRDLCRDGLGHGRLGQDHEVVATDVTREMAWRMILLEYLEHDRRERLDHVIAAEEPVVVVVALEGIDVRVEDREAFVVREPAADLAQDVAVAAHAGQRAQAACRRGPGHHGAQSRDELLGDEWLGHVVVRAREQVLHLVLERVADGEKDDGYQTRAKVVAKLGHDLVARHVAEHQVEQDDVGPPVDRRFVRRAPVVDGDALESRTVEHPLDESQHLVVVVDHQDDLATDQRGLGPVRGGARPSHDGHVVGPGGRGSFSVSAIARSAAALTSWMSARMASGSSSSSPINSL